MNKQDMLKIQTCVLRVNIHCEGCMHKVKKKLQKVDGVYKVSIDSEQGKVVVSGNADPASLIEKLEKAGKHAELWGGPQKPAPVFVSGDQLKKFQMESMNKTGKKGNLELQQHKNGNGFVQIPQEKGLKEGKLFSAKDQKSVKFNLPENDEFDDDDYSEDDYSDEEFEEEGFETHKKPAPKDHKEDKDGKAKKGGGGGGGLDTFLKNMLKKTGRKKGDSAEKSKKGENKKDGGDKNAGKKGGFELGDLKKGKNDDGRSKKGGDGGKQQQGFSEAKANHKGGGGAAAAGGGRNMGMMGQKGGVPSVAGIPAMNGGHFAGAGPGNNPYSQQQQYMAHMMMMNQQRDNGYGAYHPSAYAPPQTAAMSYGPPPGMAYGPPPAMRYGPPPATSESYANMFSDENTDSCSIM